MGLRYGLTLQETRVSYLGEICDLVAQDAIVKGGARQKIRWNVDDALLLK